MCKRAGFVCRLIGWLAATLSNKLNCYYRDALEFAHRQLFISEELDNPNMRAESYLNLSRAHQRMGGLERALAYARHSLYNECEQCTTAGHVHLTVGSVYLELAGFNKALDSFQHAHRIAQAVHDPALELQVTFSTLDVVAHFKFSILGLREPIRAVQSASGCG